MSTEFELSRPFGPLLEQGVAVELDDSRAGIAIEKPRRLQFGKVDVNEVRPDELPRRQLRTDPVAGLVSPNALDDRFERNRRPVRFLKDVQDVAAAGVSQNV